MSTRNAKKPPVPCDSARRRVLWTVLAINLVLFVGGRCAGRSWLAWAARCACMHGVERGNINAQLHGRRAEQHRQPFERLAISSQPVIAVFLE